jgi:hypothetical protein
VNRAPQERERHAGKWHRLQREPHEHHVAARPGGVPRLQHGLHVGRVGLRLDLRWHRLNARRLDNEVGPARHGGIARPSPRGPAGEAAIVGTTTQLADALHDAVALGIGIERRRRAHLHGELAPVCDRIDDDDLPRAHHPRGLDGAQSHRPGTEDHHVGPWLKHHVRVTGGKPEAS